MSCNIYFYMLLIVLLFAIFGIFFRSKEKQSSRDIMDLRKEYCQNKHEEKKKNVRKQELKKEEEKCRKCKKVCFVVSVFVFSITVVLLIGNIMANIIKPIIIQNKINAMLIEMGGKVESFKGVEVHDTDHDKKDVVEELLSAMPCWELYKNCPESGINKRQSYVDALCEELDNKENWTLEKYVCIDPEDERESNAYAKNIELLGKMELDRVPEGYSLEDVQQGKVAPLPVAADTAMREADMRWENYYIKPDASMLKQASKASADAAIGFSEDSSVIEIAVKYAAYAVNGYLGLMRYEGAGESKADCCFWIAKVFRIISGSMPKEWVELVEHCEMLSYAFCELGVRYLSELNEKNDHADELLQLREEMDILTR